MPLPGDQHKDTPASANPFAPSAPRVSEYTAREIATLQSRLDKQLGPEYISTRQGAGGGKVHYITGDKAINLANDVFGFNGWSTSIQNVQIDFVDENASGKISLGLSTILRITLRDGTFHEDIGYGVMENGKGKAAAFEKAKKEAVTDALKRTLRNFGNVLGNCLYDKGYLAKIDKVKAGPSRWDSDNLHRHPDYRPIKAESKADAEAKQDVLKADKPLARNQSMQSVVSTGSAEFEDDYGGNLFDEADLSHPDEVQPDQSTGLVDTPVRGAVSGPPHQQQRQVPQRIQSMPQLRSPNVQQPQLPHNGQALPRSPVKHGSAYGAASGASRMLPPLAPGQVQRPPQQVSNTALLQNQLDGHGPRSDHSSGSTVADGSGDSVQRRNLAAGQILGAVSSNEHELPQAQPIPTGTPGGFVAARGAELFNQPGNTKPAAASVAFDPTKESPSIRRTHGVNPGKSAPVRREVAKQPEYPVNSGPVSLPQPPAPIQPAQNQSSSHQAQSPAAPSVPRNGTNYINPSADPTRRIGMPSAGPPNALNRGAYKPPTAVKRPALADVSNLQQVDGATDAKKQKIESPAPEQNEVGESGVVSAT